MQVATPAPLRARKKKKKKGTQKIKRSCEKEEIGPGLAQMKLGLQVEPSLQDPRIQLGHLGTSTLPSTCLSPCCTYAARCAQQSVLWSERTGPTRRETVGDPLCFDSYYNGSNHPPFVQPFFFSHSFGKRLAGSDSDDLVADRLAFRPRLKSVRGGLLAIGSPGRHRVVTLEAFLKVPTCRCLGNLNLEMSWYFGHPISNKFSRGPDN